MEGVEEKYKIGKSGDDNAEDKGECGRSGGGDDNCNGCGSGGGGGGDAGGWKSGSQITERGKK